MKVLMSILLSLLLAFQPEGLSASGEQPGSGHLRNFFAEASGVAVAEQTADTPDISAIIFGHVGDSYEWHITRIGSRDIAIFLPVIVRTHDGLWHCFSSRHLLHPAGEHAAALSDTGALQETPEYEGLHIASEGEPHAGKIVEQDGRRPLDISITKNVLSLIMSSLLLVVLVLLCARWYRRHDSLREAPKGLAALLEPLFVMVHDMAKDNIGEDWRRYSPFLLTAFLFILLNNFMGILPIFPGGANLTGNIACTLVLALFTFFTVNLTGTKHYYEEMLNPDVPGVLKPLMAVIEVFSALVKPISLTIRLFANMLAGHIQILCMVSIIFIMAKYGGVLLGGMSALTVLFGIFLDVLEMLISFIQAYIFTMLSSIYIGLARVKH